MPSRTFWIRDRASRRGCVCLGVDPALGVAQEAAGAAGAHREDLAEDRERRLLLALGADVEAAGPGDAVERRLGTPASSRRARRFSWLRREPSAPM